MERLMKWNCLGVLALVIVILACCTGSATGSGHSSHEAQADYADDNTFLLDQQDGFTLENLSNDTNKNNTGVSSTAVGFIGAAVAVLFFGSNLVPIKNADTGDGMFYQWIDGLAIWQVGLIVNLIRNSPPFYPLAMLGGFLWTTGNVTVVPIIKTIGLSLGILIWGSLNLLMGWASGHFGLFGIKKDELNNPAFNYIGVSLALLSAVLYVLVKPEVSQAAPSLDDEQANLVDNPAVPSKPVDELRETCVAHGDSQPIETSPLLADTRQKAIVFLVAMVAFLFQVAVITFLSLARTGSSNSINTLAEPTKDSSWVDKLSPLQKRVVGVAMAICAGCLYGFNFVPCIWIQDNVEGASQNGLDYVFAHFCGICLTSSVYFMLYCIYMRNRPQIGVGVVIPSVVSGVMWGIAQSGWFIANFNLSESVSFPIITTGPGIIASLWGVLLFREIRGVRNLLVLGLAFAITITGAIFTAFSK